MKRALACTIDSITAPGQDAWILTIAAEDVSDAIIYLTALQYGKITQLRLTDRVKTADIERNRLLLNNLSVSITADWLDAVLSMLLDIQLNGWSHPAHLDQDFTTANGEICVCIAVAPPLQNIYPHLEVL